MIEFNQRAPHSRGNLVAPYRNDSIPGDATKSFTGGRRFVGIGFGPIQAGLFLHEADASGAYAPPTVVDIREDLVAELRWHGRRHADALAAGAASGLGHPGGRAVPRRLGVTG
jgi:hypothetical protein